VEEHDCAAAQRESLGRVNQRDNDPGGNLLAIVNLLFSVFLTSFGAFGLAHQIRDLSRSWSSRRWPKAEAMITSASVHERRGSRGRTVFEPTVEYRYNFQNQTLTGHRIAFGDVNSRNRQEADRVAGRFTIGTLWEVSVCEGRSDLSVLHAGPTRQLWFGLAFFAGYTCFATAFLIDALRRLG
jgi:hypothetical protein